MGFPWRRAGGRVCAAVTGAWARRAGGREGGHRPSGVQRDGERRPHSRRPPARRSPVAAAGRWNRGLGTGGDDGRGKAGGPGTPLWCTKPLGRALGFAPGSHLGSGGWSRDCDETQDELNDGQKKNGRLEKMGSGQPGPKQALITLRDPSDTHLIYQSSSPFGRAHQSPVTVEAADCRARPQGHPHRDRQCTGMRERQPVPKKCGR